MECQCWSPRLSSIHRPDNSLIYVGSTHPLLVATDVVLAFVPCRNFCNVFCLYLFHPSFHRNEKTNFFFSIFFCIDFFVSPSQDTHYEYSFFFWTVFYLFPLIVQLEVVYRPGRLSNTPSDYILPAILRILTLPAPIMNHQTAIYLSYIKSC